jgi:uncharacterized repeat protein (TIGR03943 family)
VNRQAQAVVLLLLGGSVLKASITDMYLRYVRAGLQPFLIAAGIVLVAAAVMTLVYDLRAGATDGLDHDHGAGGKHREPRVGWLLILPVLGLLLVAPPALGSYAAGQAGTALSSQTVSDYAPLPAGDPAKITMLDYASRAIFDGGRSLGDRRVEVSGFLSPGADGAPLLTRMILTCCAADGRPIKLGMSGNVPSGLAADTWVQVVGKYSAQVGADAVNGERIPYLEVETWTEIPSPKDPYE